jgi:hypothetical protein
LVALPHSGLEFFAIAGALPDWEAGILGELGVGLRELAEEELGTAIRGDETSVKAIGAESEMDGRSLLLRFKRH